VDLSGFIEPLMGDVPSVGRSIMSLNSSPSRAPRKFNSSVIDFLRKPCEDPLSPVSQKIFPW